MFLIENKVLRVLLPIGSAAPANVKIESYNAAQKLQDDAAERCSMTYRAPELFNVQSPCSIDERTDIWVKLGMFFEANKRRYESMLLPFNLGIRMSFVCTLLLQITVR